jgi:hypothetical protein
MRMEANRDVRVHLRVRETKIQEIKMVVALVTDYAANYDIPPSACCWKAALADKLAFAERIRRLIRKQLEQRLAAA